MENFNFGASSYGEPDQLGGVILFHFKYAHNSLQAQCEVALASLVRLVRLRLWRLKVVPQELTCARPFVCTAYCLRPMHTPACRGGRKPLPLI